MKITVHVPTTDAIATAREEIEAAMREGDEGEIIVAQPVNAPVERQERRPAGGVPANVKD